MRQVTIYALVAALNASHAEASIIPPPEVQRDPDTDIEFRIITSPESQPADPCALRFTVQMRVETWKLLGVLVSSGTRVAIPGTLVITVWRTRTILQAPTFPALCLQETEHTARSGPKKGYSWIPQGNSWRLVPPLQGTLAELWHSTTHSSSGDREYLKITVPWPLAALYW